MILNTYEKGKVKKTFRCDAYDLPFGIVEDVAKVIDLDSIGNASNADIIKMITNTALRSMDDIKVLFFDMFPEMTEDDLKQAKIYDMAVVLLDVVKYTIGKLKASFSAKN